MCVIMILKAGIVPPYEAFKNAVFNNPHGWGLVLKDDDRLEVKKGFDEKGNDPEALYELISKNHDVERYLHLRWATDGKKDLDNTQPFPVYSSNSRDVYFMHNGILHDFKPPHTSSPLYEDDDMRDASDSRRFAERKLTPLLLRFHGSEGNADIQDPLFQEIVGKYWSVASRGLLISSNQEPFLINKGNWKEIKYKVKGKIPDPENPKKKIDGEIEKSFLASNDDYFDRLQRGPEFERLAEIERKKKAQEYSQTSAFNRGPSGANREVKRLTSETFRSRYFIEPGRLGDLVNIDDLYDDNNITVLGALSAIEVETLSKENPNAASMLIMMMSSMITQFAEDREDALDDLAKAQKACEEMSHKLKQYEAQTNGKGKVAA